MSYCSLDNIIHEFTPTLKLNMDRDYGEALSETLEGHLDKAEAFVNASLARAYSVPLKKAAPIVVSATSKIAAYFAAIAYSEKDEIVRDKYETALLMLDYLVLADNPALVDDALSSEDIASSGVLYGADNRIFTSDELQKW